jgi:hypothetical protein
MAVWDEYEEMTGCQQAAFRAKLCWAAMLAAAPGQVDESADTHRKAPDENRNLHKQAKPAGTLHGDGYFTWKGTEPYEARGAGWRADFYVVPPQDALDAKRWRAFIGSARLRMFGSAGLVELQPEHYAHMGMEIWTKYGRPGEYDFTEENKLGIEWLTKYADIAIEAQRATAPAAASERWKELPSQAAPTGEPKQEPVSPYKNQNEGSAS